MIQVDQITRSIDGARLLSGVSLEIAAGDAVGLIGPSGSGKTSLLRAIARLDPLDPPPDADSGGGVIRFHGRVVDGQQIPAFRRRVVYLAQQAKMIPGTVEENFRFAFEFLSASARLDLSMVHTWMGQAGLPETLLGQDAMTLSGGQRQWVALIRALLLSPDVLLLDEPTVSLDQESVRRFEALLTRWKADRSKRAWVWASHDHHQVLRMTSRQIHLQKGVIIDAPSVA